MYDFWNKVIYSIFSIPISLILGPLVCWGLSHYYPNLNGIGNYVLSILVSIIFTTILCFLFPTTAAKILTRIIQM